MQTPGAGYSAQEPEYPFRKGKTAQERSEGKRVNGSKDSLPRPSTFTTVPAAALLCHRLCLGVYIHWGTH